jgi:hypothetical protein
MELLPISPHASTVSSVLVARCYKVKQPHDSVIYGCEIHVRL